MEPLLLTIDTMNLIRRVYEANPAPDSESKAKAAVFAANKTFEHMLRCYPATHHLLVADAPGKNWRHDIYPEYKAARKPIFEPLRLEIDRYLHILRGLGWYTLTVPGVEADDTMNSVAQLASQRGLPSLTLTTDKDMVHLLTYPGCRVRDHFGANERTSAWCVEKFGVEPHLLQDLLALTGDTSDGIPGVHKVGAKTAAKWLLEFGSLQGVLDNAEHITGKVGENLRAQKERAVLSRKLVEMRSDVVPQDFDFEALVRANALG